MPRPSRILLPAVVSLVLSGASNASAQASQAPAARPGATTAPAKPKATPSRFKAAPKAPLAALSERGANPSGPFARLNEVQRDSIIENSRSLLGVRYKWAGETPERGVDCSGLVKYVFAKLGIALPHHAAALARLGAPIGKDTSDMRVGDLLVFSKMKSKRISHVGIYVGDGMMVHASSTSKQVVETPIVEYRDKMNLRGVRRVFSLDSAAVALGTPQTP